MSDGGGDGAAALRLDRGIRMRAAAQTRPVPGGLVVRHSELFDVHYLNAILLDAGAEPDDVAALAERWQGDLGHRHVVFDDADAGERAAAELAGLGWERQRTVYMAFRGTPVEDPRARIITDSELGRLQTAAMREELGNLDARAELATRLVASQSALRQSTEAISFGAGQDGALQSMCTLLLHDGAAMVTEVGTLAGQRRRGLARAAVSAAVREARGRGAAPVALATDADDWPQLMYASLGFAPVARQVALTRRVGSVRSER